MTSTSTNPTPAGPPVPYDGDGPYLFLSYKREDMPRIAPYLAQVAAWGYPIWYDRGITGGSEWDALIEEKVERSALLLLFLSPAAVQSKFVRREVKFADQLNRTILTVRLEPVQLAHGLNMLLSQYQMLDVTASDFADQLQRALTRYVPRADSPPAGRLATDPARDAVGEAEMRRATVASTAPADKPAAPATEKATPAEKRADRHRSTNTTPVAANRPGTTVPPTTPVRRDKAMAGKVDPPPTAVKPMPNGFGVACGGLGWFLGTALATALMLSDHSLTPVAFLSGALVLGGPAAFGGLWAAPRLWSRLPNSRQPAPVDPSPGPTG